MSDSIVLPNILSKSDYTFYKMIKCFYFTQSQRVFATIFKEMTSRQLCSVCRKLFENYGICSICKARFCDDDFLNHRKMLITGLGGLISEGRVSVHWLNKLRLVRSIIILVLIKKILDISNTYPKTSKLYNYFFSFYYYRWRDVNYWSAYSPMH